MNQHELDEALRLHKIRLNNEDGGKRADLRGAVLTGAVLSGAVLSDADLREAVLTGANLRGADLREANLRGADLRWANLRGADLSEAVLTGADLRGADLRGADLRGAVLTGAVLSGAVLNDADLSEAVLTGADVDFSCWPLWCGSKGVRVDMRIVRQLLAHAACLDCDDPAFEAVKAAILPEARKSHRAAELGLLENQTGETK